jgi:GNAT superfamily N-acetyltransferase
MARIERGMTGAFTFAVRRGAADDLPALSGIWLEAAEAFVKADPRYALAEGAAAAWAEAMNGLMARPDAAIFVAAHTNPSDPAQHNRAIGYIVGTVEANMPGLMPARYGLVSDLAVDFHAKSGRIGREMYYALQDWFRAQRVTHIEARVPFRHPVAQAFWRAMGATKVSERMWLGL